MGKYALNKKLPDQICDRAKKLNRDSMFINIHDHMMFEFAIHKSLGHKNIFDTYYYPDLKAAGINVIATSVGANSPCLCNLTDDLMFGCFEQIDMLMEEQANGAHFKICRTVTEIEETVKFGKIAILLAFEGARAMEGLRTEESMVMLHTFHNLGLRVNCIVGAARTMFADGVGEKRAEAGLTTFGIDLIKEMNRIGMVVDLNHMSDRSFFDSIEASSKPVIVSHEGVRAICDCDANLSDERLFALAKNGGVVGMEIAKHEILKGSHENNEIVTFDHVIDHIDYIVDKVGIDHVGIGLDYDNFGMVHNVHRAMSPFPGSIEGFYTGSITSDHMLNDPNNTRESYTIADYLVNRGYSDEDIRKILGGNFMRVLKETIG
ncbi:MAG: membrane dipeptidase [Clostridium sp.]|uniref:dipeptidase n=1 Tax=Clostridium sp. TaxID=1506 RepID=UPI002FC67752